MRTARVVTAVVTAVVMVAALAGPASAQETPDRAQLKSAFVAALAKAGRPPVPGLDVRSVVGCYPLAGTPAGRFMCLAEMTAGDGQFSLQRVPVGRTGAIWTVFEPDVRHSPACPSAAQAGPLFAKAMGSDARVTGAPDPGDGLLTDERGKFRDKKGPMRLMCTYEVTRSMLGPVTVVAYFRYEKGAYVLDPDFETWY